MPEDHPPTQGTGAEGPAPSRRRALARLGLGVAFAYGAPVILKI